MGYCEILSSMAATTWSLMGCPSDGPDVILMIWLHQYSYSYSYEPSGMLYYSYCTHRTVQDLEELKRTYYTIMYSYL